MADYSKLSHEDLIAELKKRDQIISQSSLNATGLRNCLNTSKMENSNFILDNNAIARYSRQLILPEFGPLGQRKLQENSILIVGCGGLGCPAAIYLAAAGIGKLGLVDYDVVEISNLHRQILHTEDRIGISKVNSIMQSIKNLNSRVICTPYNLSLNSVSICNIISNYDIVLDCTDNVATRYLLNDACVLNSKPLISGSALRFEGQLTIYNYKEGPCYRCLFPKPPSPEHVTNCSDGGVLGVIPGIIGSLQALECIKMIIEIGSLCSEKMLVFDGLSFSFRTIKLRGKQSTCVMCSENSVIKELIDYEEFCGAAATDKDKSIQILCVNERISALTYKSMLDDNNPHLLIDVRLPVEMDICKLSNSINIPLTNFEKNETLEEIKSKSKELGYKDIVCICRRGNDSQKAVQILQERIGKEFTVRDVIGGLTAWAKYVDTTFPIY